MKVNHASNHPCVRRLATCALAALTLVLLVPASAAAVAPQGVTYFTVITGIGDTPHQTQPGCLQFKKNQVCANGGDCGTWEATEDNPAFRKQRGFTFTFDLLTDEGDPIQMEGQGRIDSRGPGSSMAATAYAHVPSIGLTVNLAMSGRSATPSRCRDLLEEFLAGAD